MRQNNWLDFLLSDRESGIARRPFQRPFLAEGCRCPQALRNDRNGSRAAVEAPPSVGLLPRVKLTELGGKLTFRLRLPELEVQLPWQRSLRHAC